LLAIASFVVPFAVTPVNGFITVAKHVNITLPLPLLLPPPPPPPPLLLLITLAYVYNGVYADNTPWSTRWRSWLRHCVTNRKVAGSITDGVNGIFH
jgi:hypothetical protein